MAALRPPLTKGDQVNIPEPHVVAWNGNVSKPGDGGQSPDKRFLFLLTAR